MDENKAMENQGQQPESYITSGGAGPEIPEKKRNSSAIALGAVAVILVIAIIAVIVMGTFSKKPEEAVREAFSLTGEKMQALSDHLMAEIPACQAFQPSAEGRFANFQLSVDSVESPYLTEGLQKNMINNMLKMFSITGETVNDPSSRLAELNGELNLTGTPLVNFHVQATPEQFSFNVPMFSDTVLSVNPGTMAEEIANNPRFASMDQEMLNNLQDSLSMQLGLMTSSMGGIDAKKLQDEMYAILGGILDNAVYQKPVKDGDTKVYTVKLDGGQVYRTFLSLIKYVYIDSDLGKMYSEPMRQMFQETIIDPLESEPGPMPATLVVSVAKSGLISRVDFMADLSEEEPANDLENTLEELSGSYTLNEDLTIQEMTVTMAGHAQDNTPSKMDMTVKADYTGGNAKADLTFAMDMSELFQMDMGMNMGFDKEGNVNAQLTIEATDKEQAIPPINMDFTLGGTYTVDGEGVSKWDFPTLKIGMDLDQMGGYNAVNLNFSGESKALESPAQPDDPTTSLFAMTEDETAVEMQKYNDGINGLLAQFFGGIAGGVPEAPEAPADSLEPGQPEEPAQSITPEAPTNQ